MTTYQSLILTVCGDPGGAEAIAPVLKMLEEERRVSVVNYAYQDGATVLAKHQIIFHVLPKQIDINLVSKCLRRKKISLLLTGTSYNHLNWENFFIQEARNLAIHSLSILDFWSNYRLRFSDKAGNFVYVPDQIAVMDELAQQEMIESGFPADRIMITGHPAFDSLAEHRRHFSPQKVKDIRSLMTVNNNDLLVLFASQPFEKTFGTGYLGYDEKSVLNHLIYSLEMIRQRRKKRITLLIRPHPRETESDFKFYRSNKITILVSKEHSSREVAMVSDLVIGMSSILLVEACYLGCIVLSLQPGLIKPDVLPTNRNALSVAVYKESDVMSTIEKFLLDESVRSVVREKLNALTLASQASRCIVNYIDSQI